METNLTANAKLLFFDIETHRVKNWDELTPALQLAFENHLYDGNNYEYVEECFNDKASLNAGFSQPICVSLGYEKEDEFRLFSIHSTNEIELLTQLSNVFDKFQSGGYSLAGHNINGFDKPYLIKRYISNRMAVPKILNSIGAKPWELTDVDTMQLWKTGGWLNDSLEVICAVLGINYKSLKNNFKCNIIHINWDELKESCEEKVKASYEIYKIVNTYLNMEINKSVTIAA